MGLRINTNVMALQAQRHLREHTRRAHQAMERLASGLRINRAGDDPAGLAISEGLKGRIRALEVAGRNAADGISLVQVAEGGLDTVAEMLIRMKELAVQARSGALDDTQRSYLDREFQALKEEITRIAGATEFNGNRLLDGSLGTVTLGVGSGTGGSGLVTVGLGFDASAAGLGLGGLDILAAGDLSAGAALAGIDAAIDQVSGHRAGLGASQNRLESVIRMNASLAENLAAANSRIRDADVAAELAALTSARILQQAAVAVLAQAQRQPNLVLFLLDASSRRR
ncbi:MAG: flagellin FliC [Krumholzibacteria bacterium]|nr:flagellin FliC [Candidatus Krumholzibacteria bacterium]